tara:strand:+ start:1278 stop:3386 length:2109 start_codon:yes stop_codon:yes gene_type:complete
MTDFNESEAKKVWIEKTKNSPAAKIGAFTDDERWELHKKNNPNAVKDALGIEDDSDDNQSQQAVEDVSETGSQVEENVSETSPESTSLLQVSNVDGEVSTEISPQLLEVGKKLKEAGVTENHLTFGAALKAIETLEGSDLLKDIPPAQDLSSYDKFLNANTPCPDETGSNDSLSIGFQVVLANPCQDTTVDKQKAHMENFFNKVTGPNKDLVNMPKEIKSISKAITNDMSGFVSKMSGSLNDQLEKSISKGFQNIAALHFAKVGAGYPYAQAIKDIIRTQESLLPAVSGLLDSVVCLDSKIEKILPDMIADLLAAAIPKAVAVPVCLVDETIGALNFKMINLFDSLVTPQLGPLLNILKIGFDVKGFLLGISGGLSGIKLGGLGLGGFGLGGLGLGGLKFGGGINFHLKAGAFSLGLKCPDEVKVKCPTSSIYTIGKGIQKGKSLAENIKGFQDITKGTAITQAAAAVKGVGKTAFEKEYGVWQSFGSSAAALKKGVDKCTPIPPKCMAPKVEFFGGGGTGAAGIPIMGGILSKFDPNNIFIDVKKTGNIVGVEITSRGSGYLTEPVVTIQDNCNQGYGAYARAHIDHNPQSPTYGQVIYVTILTPGTNYPAEDEAPLFIDRVIIEDPGRGYADDDTLDNFDLDIQDGKIVGGRLKNIITYDDLPKLNINSETGVGAILRPVLSKTRPQGKVVEVIDCVGRY